jgi:hypothetical protein
MTDSNRTERRLIDSIRRVKNEPEESAGTSATAPAAAAPGRPAEAVKATATRRAAGTSPRRATAARTAPTPVPSGSKQTAAADRATAVYQVGRRVWPD